MSDLEPNTRAENFWVNEGDLEPITRKEQYIKHLYDETQVVPEYPKTREEYFINKAGEELHDVTVEQLKVTENGTYSEEGKAFSPVIVNVQPDLITKSITANGTYNASADNADGYSSVNVNVEGYKITDVSGLPSAIATFSDGANLPMPKLEVAIEPVQDLHGYDHPWVGGAGKNICSANLNDWTIAQPYLYLKIPRFDNSIYTMSFVDKDTSVDISDISIGFMNNFSAGDMTEFNWVVSNGVIRDNKTNVSIQHGINCDTIIIYRPTEAVFNKLFQRFYIQVEAGSTATDYEPYSNICPISGWSEANVTVADDVETPTVSNVYTIDLDGTRYGGTLDVVSGVLTLTHGYIASYNGETLPSTWISDRDVYAEGTTPTIGAEVCYELATPLTIQLSPTAVKSLLGTNNLSANTGDVVEASYWESL